MSDEFSPELSGVAETLLIPLYYRAIETQHPDAMIKDHKAVELIKRLSSEGTIRYNADWFKQTPMSEVNKVLRIMLTRQMDRYVRDFLGRQPKAVVVHIGCGLDSRFERVDNGQVEWYDLDLPDVIELRRKLIGDEGGRYHLLACSVLEDAWMETVMAHRGSSFLFLAEGVFMYFEEAQVKSLVLRLRDRFSGAELVFDAWRPFEIWIGNRVLGGLLPGVSGTPRNSKVGVTIYVYSTNGATSTSLSRGCAPFVGWLPSGDCSNRYAFFASSLEPRLGETFFIYTRKGNDYVRDHKTKSGRCG